MENEEFEDDYTLSERLTIVTDYCSVLQKTIEIVKSNLDLIDKTTVERYISTLVETLVQEVLNIRHYLDMDSQEYEIPLFNIEELDRKYEEEDEES